METDFSLGSLESRSLESLEALVEKRIWARVGASLRHLKVISLPGELVLRGSCATWYAKQLVAEAALESCPGVLVWNELEVG
jgi:hypothetical protein